MWIKGRRKLNSDRWIAPRKETLPEIEERRSTISFGLYFLAWAQRVATEHPVPKVGLAAVIAVIGRVQGAITAALLFVLVAWGVDFVVGVSRSIADPDVRLRFDRVQNGILRLLVIPTIAVMAAMIEGMTFAAIGWDPGGKFVLAVCVAMFWEECISIVRNARFFYRTLRFRFGGLPWLEPNKDAAEILGEDEEEG